MIVVFESNVCDHTWVVSRYGRQLERFGACVMGYDDIYADMKGFRCKLDRQRNSGDTPSTKLYFVSVDVEKCYDNIKLDKLMELLRDLLREDELVAQMCTQFRTI